MNTAHKIKVLIVDDHPMVRRGLKVLLETFDDLEVVADIGDGRLALALYDIHHPDVVITDLMMPLMGGVNVTRLILDKFPRAKIIVLTSSVDEILIRAALKAGVMGYVLKTGSTDDIVTTIRAAYRGNPTLAPEAVSALITTVQSPDEIGSDLTKREREILAFIVDGCHNNEIAQLLFISPSTVKNHMGNIYSKLHTASRTKVTALAMQHNLYTRS